MHFIYILFAEWKRHAAIPYSITVLQYYSISVYHFGIAIEVYYIYNINIIYIIKSFVTHKQKLLYCTFVRLDKQKGIPF